MAWRRLQGRSVATVREYTRYLAQLAERVPITDATLTDVLEFVADGATPAIRARLAPLSPEAARYLLRYLRQRPVHRHAVRPALRADEKSPTSPIGLVVCGGGAQGAGAIRAAAVAAMTIRFDFTRFLLWVQATEATSCWTASRVACGLRVPFRT